MAKKYGKLSKNKFLLLAFLIILFLIYCYLPLAVKIKKLNRLIKDIEIEIVNLEKQNRFLETERKKLESDLDYIGRLARENLDLIRPGEILYKIVRKQPRGGAAR